MTEISKIASVSGQPGLFVITTALKNGVILESLDEKKTRVVAGAQSKVSVLSEISIYTSSADGSVALSDVLKSVNEKYGSEIPVQPKSDAADLKKFLVSVLIDADLERVYPSDIKKLVAWYLILLKYAPEVLGAPLSSAESAEEKPAAKAKARKSPKASAA